MGVQVQRERYTQMGTQGETEEERGRWDVGHTGTKTNLYCLITEILRSEKGRIVCEVPRCWFRRIGVGSRRRRGYDPRAGIQKPFATLHNVQFANICWPQYADFSSSTVFKFLANYRRDARMRH